MMSGLASDGLLYLGPKPLGLVGGNELPELWEDGRGGTFFAIRVCR